MMPNESFLQSGGWERFNQAMGSPTWRVHEALVIKVDARRGTFLLVPHIGFFSEKLRDALIDLGKKEKCAFIRVCPLMEDTEENRLKFKNLKFNNAPVQMHPWLSWILDITKPEAKLLSEMRKTTRYSIRKAEKEAVAISPSDNLDLFWEIYDKTVQRQNFTPFSKKYLQIEHQFLDTKFYFAAVGGKTVAAAMIVFTPDCAFYHHGASLAEHPTASYLLQWRVIQEAKRRGCQFYNFWGVVRDDQHNHPWYGLSQFKKGFGGIVEAYVPAQDFVLSPHYWITYVFETIRRIKRGL